MSKIKYWVSELSKEAQQILYTHCFKQLEEQGYHKADINNYLNDLQFEKLINLDELVSHDMMIQLSEME
ncbi:hypothetical protein M3649_04030 [Ureibacillus chungkukjangi]|uniref:hypothetical protein n=1 Tax=Ureibacillus chungkukjangi TaxID=1202712 RepID=UPI00203ACCB6|nr:hypothetical protein [Ureibacillus chungkukjangi]MCM3387301.1 hypothetical protein [Ureibacillus chungkukjangi]